MTNTRVNWTEYAQAYDIMTEHNPAYQEIVESCVRTVCAWPLQAGDRIVDLGAGTGNFSVPLASKLPNCTVIHIDADPGMCAVARSKAVQLGLSNHLVITRDAFAANLATGTVAGVTCIHSLYTMSNPRGLIRLMADWLAHEGRVYACDAGRRVDLFDWTSFILGETARRDGLAAAARLVWDARAAIIQNRRISARQKIGGYWLHDLREFRSAFEQTGFAVEESFTCYRGYSDVVVARKYAKGDDHVIE